MVDDVIDRALATDEYEADAFCHNCGYIGPVKVPVGHLIYTVACPVCQTRSLISETYRQWRAEGKRTPWES